MIFTTVGENEDSRNNFGKDNCVIFSDSLLFQGRACWTCFERIGICLILFQGYGKYKRKVNLMKIKITKLDGTDMVGMSMALMQLGYEDIAIKRDNRHIFLNFAKIKPKTQYFENPDKVN